MSNILDEFFKEWMKFDPDTAGKVGIHEHKSDLKDMSINGMEKEYNLFSKYLKKLENISENRISVPEKAIKIFLKNSLEGKQYMHNDYTINHYAGFHIQTVTLLTQYHSIIDEESIKNYIQRLRKYPARIRDVGERTLYQKDHSIIPHIAVIGRVQNMLNKFVSLKPRNNVLFTHVINNLKEQDRKRYSKHLDTIEHIIEKDIYPAYRGYMEIINDVKQSAHEETGLWNLDNGKEYYEYLIRTYTTLNITPDDVHKTGKEEVARIKDEVLASVSRLGYSIKAPYRSVMSNYYYDISIKHPELFYINDPANRKRVIEDFQTIIDSSFLRKNELFDINIENQVKAENIPQYRTSGAGAYYDPPPLEGSREGKFYIHPDWYPFKPSMPVLAYHETIPGHHLQFSTMRQSELSHPIQNIVLFIGFVEGWALYAERLAYEKGWMDDPYKKIEYLLSELFRSVRLVVDTGMHYLQWSRQDCYNYMEENLGWGSYAQIDRYAIWPGHACAYKMGEKEILRIRKSHEDRLKDNFNLKNFHIDILKYGSLPFEIVNDIMNS